MLKLFQRNNSKEKLKDRLKLVLSYDRANLSPGRLEDLKAELLAVIAKHFPEAARKAKIDLKQTEDRVTLKAHLPVEAD